MTSDNLSALIARLEAASQGSVDLDKAIKAALGYTWRGMAYWSADNSHQWPHGQHLTTSIDAASTLVPEGWQRTINDADNMRDCIVELFHDPTDAEVTVRGKTWPLTICIAALKARTTGEHTTT